MSSNRLSAEETLELIRDFTSGVQSFSEREGRIDYAERLNSSSQRQGLEEQKLRVEREMEESIDRARSSAGEKRELAERTAKARKKRTDKAQMNVRNGLIGEIRQQEGHFKYGLQKKLIDAGKQRETNLKAARAQHEATLSTVADREGKFENLEERALKSLKGYKSVKNKLAGKIENIPPAAEADEERLDALYRQSGKAVALFKKQPLPMLFSSVPLVILIISVIILGLVAPSVIKMITGAKVASILPILAVTGGLVVFIVLLYSIGSAQASAFFKKGGRCLVDAKSLRQNFVQGADEELAARVEQIEAAHQQVKNEFDQGLKGAGSLEHETRYESPAAVDERGEALRDKLKSNLEIRLKSIQEMLDATIEGIRTKGADQLNRVAAGEADIPDFAGQRSALIQEWGTEILPQEKKISEESARLTQEPEWLKISPAEWVAPAELNETLPIGAVRYSLESAEAALREDSQLSLATDTNFDVPLRLKFPECGSLLIETKNSGREEAINALNYMVLGLLAGSPPGRLSFSLFDPVGLGESFAGLMHLADYEEILINTRIRTQSEQIERRLCELCDHMEKVIQMYLRNEYDTISEYNEAAGTIAERYHFIVIADFPKQFTDEAARRLQSIASAGARCGVFMLIHCDERAELPSGFSMEDLRNSCLCVKAGRDGFSLRDAPVPGLQLSFFQPPANEQLIEWVHKIGEANRDSNRIEVPFEHIAPGDEDFWSSETHKELRVPIGRTGATKLQYLAMGKGTCQHALIAGKTGSGKSTLFHVMITNLALWCDPDQVEFYLIDFKKGVEFKCYADHNLPHARVIAIESDREFGLSVLQRLDEELKARGEKFREMGVQDVAGYVKAGGKDPVPRTLLMIDEFQEFFVEDDQISQQAAVLMDRIVRQGRAFGVHAILGSQTLGGAFTLARATLGQMVIRIALQCNEADAYLIMDDTNPAPRMLTRPGEGIYNDSAGAIEANSPFQVVWMTDEGRDAYLSKVEEMAKARGLDDKPQVVFEGNAPAHVGDDKVVSALLGEGAQSGTPRLFIGAPNAIKGPTEIPFERQSGSNLMIVGQREDAVEAMTAVGIRLLASQMGERCRIVLIDGQVSDPNSQSWLKEVMPHLEGRVEVPASHEMGDTLNSLAAEMKAKGEGGAPAGDITTFVFILGLQRYKKLRYEEDFSFSLEEGEGDAKPSDSLNDLICEGAALGYHFIVSLDTYNNVNRCISRKALAEFEKKVLFQMSAADSASLIDSGKASDLGMNRAVYYNEPTGVVEMFRPYAQPSAGWFD